ncbi:MAG: polysaccharide biosynthesis/export family protein [Prevotella sp.]
MKRFSIPSILMVMALLVASCTGSKKVAYFQNLEQVNLEGSKGLYDAKIMPKDMLMITVSTLTPEAAAPFNLTVGASVSSSGQLGGGSSSLQGYLVDNQGNINFPVVGPVHVQGLTKTECQELIAQQITPYLSKTEKPIVTVRMSSYHVTVMGEVGSPGVIPVTTEKMSIIEALAEAGDLTIYGKRENVVLIRETETGKKEYHYLNLNDANIFNSPYYYLQQNDIVYVEPNNVKAKNSSIGQSTTLWFSFVGIVTSVASLLVNILRN